MCSHIGRVGLGDLPVDEVVVPLVDVAVNDLPVRSPLT